MARAGVRRVCMVLLSALSLVGSSGLVSAAAQTSATLAAVAGSLDPAFGVGGRVTTLIGDDNGFDAGAVAIQSDGKIVAAGNCAAEGSPTGFCLTRYTARGTLDPALSGDGKVITAMGLNQFDYATAMAIQTDGKIVAAGTCAPDLVAVFCLARYESDGSLDPSFGAAGKVMPPMPSVGLGSIARAVAIQPDGKIVAAGGCGLSTGQGTFCLARYTTDGLLDVSFGPFANGTVTTAAGSQSAAFAMAIQGDGKIVAAGDCGSTLCLVRYNNCFESMTPICVPSDTNFAGTLDDSFGVDGVASNGLIGSQQSSGAIAIQDDASIVAATGCSGAFCVARYKGDGSLDPAFGGDGIVTTPINAGAGATAVAIQGDGGIVAAGYCGLTCVVRYEDDGNLDTSFGINGIVIDVPAPAETSGPAFGMAIQTDGNIVTAGPCLPAPGFCLSRFLGGAVTLSSIAVTPINSTIGAGTDQQFAATGTYSDTSTSDVSAEVNWASSSTAVATIGASGLAHGVSQGNTTISATLGAVSGSTVLTVSPPGVRLNQRISFAKISAKTMAQSPLLVTATASSGLAVTFTTLTPAVCTEGGLNGATITFNGPGTCTVRAAQAGNAAYNPAPTVIRSFPVRKLSQKITFARISAKTIAQSPLVVSATASSGLAVTFTTSTPAVCTEGGFNGATITFLGPGTCTVRATQPGNAVYNPAAAVIRSFAVSKVDQAITFAKISAKTLAESPLVVSATASSGLTVTFTTSTLAVCVAGGPNGSTITFITVGTCTVRAAQPGDTIYKPAPEVIRSIIVR